MSRAFELARQQAVLQACRTPLARQEAGEPGGGLSAQHPAWALVQVARLRTDTAGLRAYQVNAQATAQRVLSAHYPTVAAMLGDDTLKALALILWREAPPTSGDLGEWGGALPELLARHPDLQAWPWLADGARLDWARHSSKRAADAALDANSLHRLGDTEPEHLCIDLQPSVRVLTCPWPVAALWAAHQLVPAQQASAAEAALAHHEGPCTTLVWRHAGALQMADLPPADGHWMRALSEGPPQPTLATLLTQAPIGFDFTAWLNQALRQGWLWRVRVQGDQGH